MNTATVQTIEKIIIIIKSDKFVVSLYGECVYVCMCVCVCVCVCMYVCMYVYVCVCDS